MPGEWSTVATAIPVPRYCATFLLSHMRCAGCCSSATNYSSTSPREICCPGVLLFDYQQRCTISSGVEVGEFTVYMYLGTGGDVSARSRLGSPTRQATLHIRFTFGENTYRSHHGNQSTCTIANTAIPPLVRLSTLQNGLGLHPPSFPPYLL